MSYAFDVASRAWETLRQQLPEDQRDGKLATRFGFLLEQMHDANHRVGDAINKDIHVTAEARRLNEALKEAV